MNLVQANIDKHWDDIKHGIYSIKEQTHESETAQDIYRSCKNNTATLWLDKDIQPKDAFLITQILKRKTFLMKNIYCYGLLGIKKNMVQINFN